MSDYRRYYVPGGTFFFTVVTHNRRPILSDSGARKYLHEAFHTVKQNRPFYQLAAVLLPEHLHVLWALPTGDSNYGVRIKRIKEEFTTNWMRNGGSECAVTASQRRRGERGIWQPRFWEHTIRDEEDLEAYFDYIHWNPRKHSLVPRVRDWPWSTFHKYARQGHYDIDWGGTEPVHQAEIETFGEPE